MGWVWLDGVGDMAKEKAREASRDPPPLPCSISITWEHIEKAGFQAPHSRAIE